MTLYENLKKKKREIIDVAHRHGAGNVRLFGSVARGEEGDSSDIDLLVKMESGRDLFDLIEIEQELQDILGRAVDVLTDGGLSPYLREKILAEARPL